MDQSKLKKYAPQARLDFIAAVTERAAFYGLTDKGIEPILSKGDVIIIGQEAFPSDVAVKRKQLEERIERDGFQQTMEAMAYSWFNRFAAIRYMELHGFLDHGYRVLSHPEELEQPEILEHAADLELSGLDRDKVVDLKLKGNKDEELYRLLLIAQCNALHKAMPFLFEEIGNATELLLPANLLHTDSLVRQLVESIDESAWDEIEIIGWLYQFYISEKKDQVIGKVVKSEDIPAATQLFTPNWIVKYMVQNSLGAQWLATYPESKLKGQMEYYIEPAEQTDEVNAQLAAITPSQLNPEELTLLDPASGSGHILVEAYELFKAIYLERGYRQRDITQLILEKNLFGLDIDNRAAQLTGFALMMKGRADDQRLFKRGVKLNVMALVDSPDFEAERLAQGVDLADYGLQSEDLAELKRLFEHATTFGSLIQAPEELANKLPALKKLSEATSKDLFVSDALGLLRPLVRQAELLTAQFDAVVANPPYMGEKGMNSSLRLFTRASFPGAKSDLFACFIERSYALAKETGNSSMLTMQSWMFLASFEKMRKRMLQEKTIGTMTQIGYNSFPSMNSKVAQATVFSLMSGRIDNYQGSFINLNSAPQAADKASVFLARDPANLFLVATEDFKNIPGSPIAYWCPPCLLRVFQSSTTFDDMAPPRIGMMTSNNERFLRSWQEVSIPKIGFAYNNIEQASDSETKWFPYKKGGVFRKWYGNNELVVNWQHGGAEIIANGMTSFRGKGFYFREGISWSFVSSLAFSCRFTPPGFIFDIQGSSSFPTQQDQGLVICLLNSEVGEFILKLLNPTLSYQSGDIRRIPVVSTLMGHRSELNHTCARQVKAGEHDWNAYERSWDFQSFPILTAFTDPAHTLESSYSAWVTQNKGGIAEMKRLEEENNRLFIDAYGLADELTPDAPIEQITLTVNPAYRYGSRLTEEELWTRFRQDTMEELVSYVIGCMMGRYSLDEPGLIYAHSGNEGFDPSRYTSFPADDDGIIPLTETEWFDDDAANRLVTFISVAWDSANLEENLKFLASNLSPKKSESSRETVRRYLCDKFFKDHLQTYKNRPIYWLFSSGRQKAFQCVVYLHRYNEGTLARVRTEYVVPLQGMMASRVRQLEGDITAADSTVHRKRLEKERSTLVKQQTELQQYDEKLRHFADQRIPLDLDDGVKVNYGKFSSLLAEVKKVTGKNPD